MGGGRVRVDVNATLGVEGDVGYVGVVFLFCLIWGRNRAPFPMPKSIFYSQLLTNNSQLKNCEKSTEENHSFLG